MRLIPNRNTDPMSTDSYLTLAGPVRHEVEIKRSRFIGCLFPVTSIEQARDHIAELRHEFHDARHRPSAFVLGAARSTARTSDDGEPAGTAGAPMLQALLGHQAPAVGQQTPPPGRQPAHKSAAPAGTNAPQLSDILAVVVRYFGGIKLGAGGLTRAYGGTVTTTLDAAPLLLRRRMHLLSVHLPLANAGTIEAALRTAGLTITSTTWNETSELLTIAANPTDSNTIHEQITALSAGTAAIEPAGEQWIDQAI